MVEKSFEFEKIKIKTQISTIFLLLLKFQTPLWKTQTLFPTPFNNNNCQLQTPQHYVTFCFKMWYFPNYLRKIQFSKNPIELLFIARLQFCVKELEKRSNRSQLFTKLLGVELSHFEIDRQTKTYDSVSKFVENSVFFLIDNELKISHIKSSTKHSNN